MSGGPRFVVAGSASHFASATSVTPALPTPSSFLNSHGLLLAVVVVKSNAVITTVTPGWTKLYQDNSGAGVTVASFIAAGDATAPVLTWAGATGVAALTAFYDDTGQPVVKNAVGGTTVNSGSGTTTSTASFNTTRNESVVVYYNGMDVNTTLAAPGTWTEDADSGSATSAATVTIGSKAVATSGSASGAISAVAGTSGAWLQRQIELLVQTMPNNFYSVEFEVAPLSRIGTGFESAEFEVVPLSRISTGFESAEFEVAPLSRISTGFESAEFEVCALTFEGEEPVPPTPEPEITKVRAWPLSLDGHDMYVLRIGETGTAVFDLTTGEQSFWDSEERTVWRAQTGATWLGRTSENDVATNIIVGDDTLGLLWSLDPEQPYDDPDTFGGPTTSFERVLTTVVPLRMRNSVSCDAVYLTANVGEPLTGNEAFTLRTSDDNGRTWRSHGTVTLTAGNYTQEVSWRSLGLMRAPGRIFEIVDSGASTRISNFDIRFRGMPNA